MKLKKLVSVLLVAACVFSLAACGSKDDSKDSKESKKEFQGHACYGDKCRVPAI